VFKHLLVPLDGSPMAESALPAAARLAELLGAQVTLLHVIERDAPHEVHGEPHLADPAQARAYLDGVAVEVFPPGVQVMRHVHVAAVDDVAQSIVAHSQEFEPDLIVMCTHGGGTLHSWLFGSVAQQVVALATVPLLLIRPTAPGVASVFSCLRFMVPLDGDPEHEQALSVATDLARACGAALHLLAVVPTLQTLPVGHVATARLLPGATSALLAMTQDELQEYLRRHLDTLQDQGFSATAEVVRGDPASAIVDAARRIEADLVVLATHRKKGLDAFWAGSVAPKVSGHYYRLLLLVPVG
jgi:nucleotide-binding universal stress UspA family protein